MKTRSLLSVSICQVGHCSPLQTTMSSLPCSSRTHFILLRLHRRTVAQNPRHPGAFSVSGVSPILPSVGCRVCNMCGGAGQYFPRANMTVFLAHTHGRFLQILGSTTRRTAGGAPFEIKNQQLDTRHLRGLTGTHSHISRLLSPHCGSYNTRHDSCDISAAFGRYRSSTIAKKLAPDLETFSADHRSRCYLRSYHIPSNSSPCEPGGKDASAGLR